MITTYFLHGLESSGKGTKGQFFKKHFPEIHRPDFTGSLEKRLRQLDHYCKNLNTLQFIGSSYGGLMATIFAINFPEKTKKLILLAPALNFEDFIPPEHPIEVPTLLIIGDNDTVTPIDPVLSLARKTFSNLRARITEDDHMLHATFTTLDWQQILNHKILL